MRPEVLAGIGGFGALFEISKKFREPVLVSGTDGVGTKLKLAFQLEPPRHRRPGPGGHERQRHPGAGRRAAVLPRLLRLRQARRDTAATVVEGIARGCELAGCALIGGETAEMPSMYPDGEYDLAGFAVGAVEKSDHRRQVHPPGDVVLGLASSGAHSNGYSLIRKIIERAKPDLRCRLSAAAPGRCAVMAPTRIYVKPLLALMQAVPVKGMAHITGGGLTENVPRVLPEHLTAASTQRMAAAAAVPVAAKEGQVADAEMHRVFNCGIGMVVGSSLRRLSRASTSTIAPLLLRSLCFRLRMLATRKRYGVLRRRKNSCNSGPFSLWW
jgi:phosphoribosylformylglycinamidine cyclo-ligase